MAQQHVTLYFAVVLQVLDAKQVGKLRKDGMLMLNQNAAILVDQSMAVMQQVLRM